MIGECARALKSGERVGVRDGKVLIERGGFLEVSNGFLVLPESSINQAHVRKNLRGVCYALSRNIGVRSDENRGGALQRTEKSSSEVVKSSSS